MLPDRDDSQKSGVAEREFFVLPMFRRWAHRLSLASAKLVRKLRRTPVIDFDNLPSDTYIIYPDRLGNYLAPGMPQAAQMETIFAAAPMLPAAEVLRAANLNYFLRQTAEEAEAVPLMNEEVGLTPVAAEIADRPSMNPLTGDWGFLRPVLGYVAVGVVGGGVMFAIPALRRPASSLLPKGMVNASNVARPARAATDAKPAYNVTSKPDLDNGTETSEAHPSFEERNLRRNLRYEEPEVVIHHYQEPARVVRTDSGVKRYSDLQ